MGDDHAPHLEDPELPRQVPATRPCGFYPHLLTHTLPPADFVHNPPQGRSEKSKPDAKKTLLETRMMRLSSTVRCLRPGEEYSQKG